MQEDEGQEDDWSQIIHDEASSYVNHERRRVQVTRSDASDGDSKFLTVACVTHLSPLDMMDLSWGTRDATGNRVWMGALLLIESLQSLKEHFENRRVLELGCGTGIAGLAVAQVFRPQTIILTDNSEAALDLCRRNLLLNTSTMDEDVVEITQLEWGVGLASSCWKESLGTVLATDVLYDLGSLLPLLTTVSAILVPGGHFILSHVPRASLPLSCPFDNLEAYVVHQAKDFGLELDYILKPKDLPQSQHMNELSLEEMHETGAAVLVFIKQSTMSV
jgi:SAM-dependent methyltransferase